jgi:hypothetical protein
MPLTPGAGQPSGPSNPVQQISAELQSFLLQLQGGAGTSANSAQSGPGGVSGEQAVPGADPTGTGKISGAHRHHHHGTGTGGVAEAGTPGGVDGGAGPATSASSASGQGGAAASNGGNVLQSLATDIARALQSYGSGAWAGSAASAGAAQSLLGLAA